MEGDPFQAQIQVGEGESGWRSMSHEGLPYVFKTAQEAAEALRKSYPDQFREEKLDRADMRRLRVWNRETGWTCAPWRLA